jgi:hypothetical protein
MGNKGSKEGDQDKIPSGSPLGKMLKYWDDSLRTIGKKKQRMVKYCCFSWTQELILKPLVFWPKFGSNKDWVCQLLIEHEHVNKSSVTQEEVECALCWRQSPVDLFSLKDKKRQKEKKPKPLLTGIYSLPFPSLITLLVPQLRRQSQSWCHHPRLLPLYLPLLTLPPLASLQLPARSHLTQTCPYHNSRRS